MDWSRETRRYVAAGRVYRFQVAREQHKYECKLCPTLRSTSASLTVEMLLQVRLMLLAALSGEHILFLGPPGTAKSELGRRLARLYDGPFFERLLTRFSVPEVCCSIG